MSEPLSVTIGIDLASQAPKTALCIIAWSDRSAQVRVTARGTWDGTAIHDKMLTHLMTGLWGTGHADSWGSSGRPSKVAIDAPLGWPAPFVQALSAYGRLEPWPERIDNPRHAFERRSTDRFVHERTRKLPLSVSTDRIAYPAMRAAIILSTVAEHLGQAAVARDGTGQVVEAYPDAALRSWLPDLWESVRPDSYKGTGKAAQARRTLILERLKAGLGPRFVIEGEAAGSCRASDDCLDALVCALVARATERGLTLSPTTSEQAELALTEGWIHLPAEGTLSALV